jgi:hypothetical protein
MMGSTIMVQTRPVFGLACLSAIAPAALFLLSCDGGGGGTDPELPPSAPSNLVATAASDTEIDLSWTDNSANESGFRIERSSDGVSGWSQAGAVAANVTTHRDPGLNPNTTYHYRVLATGSAGPSNPSPTAQATTLPRDLHVRILAPADGAVLEEGQALELRGAATGKSGQPLLGSQLTWASDLAGALGSGEILSAPALPQGTHWIFLEANDQGTLKRDSLSLSIVPLPVTVNRQPTRADSTAGFMVGRVVVAYKAGEISGLDQAELNRRYGLKGQIYVPEMNWYVALAETDAGSTRDLSEALSSDPRVEFAAVDPLLRTGTLRPEDFDEAIQYHHRLIGTDILWDQWAREGLDVPGAGISIAVIDLEFRLDHSDLSGPGKIPFSAYVPTAGAVDIGATAADNGSYHGTWVASLAAGGGTDEDRIVGVAPGANVVPVRVDPSLSSLARALRETRERGFANLVNVSLGLFAPNSPSLEYHVRALLGPAVAPLLDEGGAVVWSAGNCGLDWAGVDVMARVDGRIVVVGGTNVAGDGIFTGQSVPTTYCPGGVMQSRTGEGLDLVAPGESLAAAWGNPFGAATGTSGSAPIVAGLIAAHASRGLSVAEARALVLNNALDLGLDGYDQETGFGRVTAGIEIRNPTPSVVGSGRTTAVHLEGRNLDRRAKVVVDGTELPIRWLGEASLAFDLTPAAGAQAVEVKVRHPGGLESAALTIPVSSGPMVTLTALPLEIDRGGTSTLTWSSANSVSCHATWTASTATSGSQVVSPVVSSVYSITCTGPAGDATASVTVAVRGSGGGEGIWQFCPSSGLPLWVAFQDGGGEWRHVTGTDDRYQISVSSPRGAVAWVVPTTVGGFELKVFYGSRAELTAEGWSLCRGSRVNKIWSGHVSGLGVGQFAVLSAGGAAGAMVASMGGTETPFVLSNVLDGPRDLMAMRLTSADPHQVPSDPDRFILRRGLNLPDGAVLSLLDFAGPESFAAATAKLSLENWGGGTINALGSYYTPTDGLLAGYLVGVGTTPGTPIPWSGVPLSHQAAGELQVLLAQTYFASEPFRVRTVQLFFTEIANKTASFGPELQGVEAFVVSSAPHLRSGVRWNIQAEYDRFWRFSYHGNDQRAVALTMTRDYVGSAVSVEIVAPDFSGVSGWSHSWAPAAVGPISTYFTASGWQGNPIWDGQVLKGATLPGTVWP